MKKLLLALAAVVIAGMAYLYSRPLPKATAISDLPKTTPAQTINLAWPATGQAALGAVGYGLLTSHGNQPPVPIASIAKIITAYAVLTQRPLAVGQSGPTITLDSTDLGFFNYYYTHGGSDTNVAVGEKITEYQALQALLLPSSNNMADSLARWAFGSVPDYITYANQMVKSMGLSHTHVGGASGFSDNTLSTASDLVQLGETALSSPVLAAIVDQRSAQIPVEGEVNNVNDLVGTDGINGIKTGNTDQAGGCYLFSSKQTVDGQTVELVGAVLDQPNLQQALQDSPPLIASAAGGFRQIKVIKSGQSLGYYQTAWGQRTNFAAASDVSLLAWQGKPLTLTSSPIWLKPPQPVGATAGTFSVSSGAKTASTPLRLSQKIAAPSIWWRLFRH